LGINFTPLDLSLVDTIESLKEKGFLKIWFRLYLTVWCSSKYTGPLSFSQI
jgi:hypothetical protein